MNRYEALLVLNTQGKDETVKEIVDRLESEFEKEGAKIEQVQKMDKRQFSYVAGELDGGHYVNFVFNADPQLIAKLRAKFKLDGFNPWLYDRDDDTDLGKLAKQWESGKR